MSEANNRNSGGTPESSGAAIGKAESAEMQTNIDRFENDNRGKIIDAGGLSTRAVHGGERQKGGIKARATLDALATPIVQTATFTFRNTAEIVGYNEGTYQSFEYGRYGNPTVRALEEKMISLEGAEDCLVSASGMNAVTTMLLALVDTNGHVVTTTDCYRRTRQFVTTVLPKMGVRLTVYPRTNLTQRSRPAPPRPSDTPAASSQGLSTYPPTPNPILPPSSSCIIPSKPPRILHPPPPSTA